MKIKPATITILSMKSEDHGELITYVVNEKQFQKEYKRQFPCTRHEDLWAIHSWLMKHAKRISKATPDYSFTMPIQ